MSRYIALNYWVFGGYEGTRTPQEFIDFAAEKKIDGVEFTIGSGFSFDASEKECAAIRAHAEKKGVGMRTLCTDSGWKCPLTSPDPTVRENAMEFARKYLQIANWLGAETILFVPGATTVPWDDAFVKTSYKTAWENTVAGLNELIPLAEKLKVNIAVENVWNRFLISPMEWKFFLDQFQSEYLGMYFDPANACLTGMPEDYPELVGDRIKAIHIKNFKRTDCGGGLHGFGEDIFDGDVNWKNFFAVMDQYNSTLPYTVEMVPYCRLPERVVPDYDLSCRMTEQMKEL